MMLTDLMAALDGVFAAAAVLCLLVARFRPVRAFDRLIRDIDALIAARAEVGRSRRTLPQLINVARRMEVVARAAAAIDEYRAPSVTAILQGRRGRFDLLGNFFVRSPTIQQRIDGYLADLRAACVDRRRAAAGGYTSPFNPLNLPSSLACYLGLDLTARQTKCLDGVAWAVASGMAAVVVALRA